MRAILVDWLVEVQESFELNHETLYTAVKLMDLYLSKVFVTKEDLQLVGATACLIACKIDERIPPNLDDFVYVCDDAYSRQEIMAKERDMIETVDYDVGYPLSYRFLRRFGRVCQVTMPVLTLARYILETSLMEYKFNVQLSESLLAAATLALAMKIQNIDSYMWLGPLRFYSGYDLPNMRPVFHALHQMMLQEQKDSTKTIRQKYSHRVFHEVALIKIQEVLDL
jgi:cyclin B